jgi:hypothetical protein
MLDGTLGSINLSSIVMAIGGLGTAAYGVVDASKALWGGVSRFGFGDIKTVMTKLIPSVSAATQGTSALTLESTLDTLRANWMNGMAMADQKSVAKALIKLNLTPESAKSLAAATGVDGDTLTSVAKKLTTKVNPTVDKLTDQETDVFGRFDLILSALLDQAYQRGDQRYRNMAKLCAVVASVVLAVLGSQYALGPGHYYQAMLAGLLATPLAPVAKDVASAIQAGTKVAQLWKK